MNAHRGIIGQEVTGQMDRQSHAQGETDMQTIIDTTKGRAGMRINRRTGYPITWLKTAILTLALSLGIAGTAQAAMTVNLTAPANNTVVAAPGSFTLTAAASVTQGSPIQSVAFYANNGTTNTLLGTVTAPPGPAIPALPAKAAAKIPAPINTTGINTYTWNWTNVPMGIYSVTVVATDKKGITSTSAPVTVVADVPPTVSLTAPADNSSAIAPANITLSANANDIDGTIAKVDFYAATTDTTGNTTNTLIGTATSTPYSYAWSNVAVGKYTITAVATDNYGAQTASAPVTITVKPGVLLPYYIHTDQMDTPREITDTSGNVVWQWDNSDPFGNNMANENPAGAGTFNFNLRFPGQYYDRETNLHYNINRDYDPFIGRYVESDPLGLYGGQFSTYTYVNGNPLRWNDPTGLLGWGDAGVGTFVGGVSSYVTTLTITGSVNDAATAGVIGAVVGGTAGYFAPPGTGSATGAAAGAAIGDFAGQMIGNQPFNWGELAGATAGGYAVGLLGIPGDVSAAVASTEMAVMVGGPITAVGTAVGKERNSGNSCP